MQTQLKVIKANGGTEEYLHTKVMGTISNALAQTGHADICIAEQLSEVVTFFLYDRHGSRSITSSEILSIIKAVLTTTKNEEAAIALSEHHFERKLKRSRTEVISIDIQELTDAELLTGTEKLDNRCRWDKSQIVDDLVKKHNLCQQTARMVASMVEEKIFNTSMTLVPSSLIKQFVLGDTAAVLRAQQQLQTV